MSPLIFQFYRKAGTTTIGRFLQSGLRVGPVFAPAGGASPSEFVLTSGPAAPAVLVDTYLSSSGRHDRKLLHDTDGVLLVCSRPEQPPVRGVQGEVAARFADEDGAALQWSTAEHGAG